MILPERHSVKATSLNQALTVHEKCLHSLFHLEFKVLQPDQAIDMSVFPHLYIDCPVCHKYKITKTSPSPVSSNKTKNSFPVGRNNMVVSLSMRAL